MKFVAVSGASCSNGAMPQFARRPVRQTLFHADGHVFIVVLLSMEEPVEPKAIEALTPSEREVALMAADGLSSQLIAVRRGRSVRTVENQLNAIYRKLRLSSRSDLVRILSSALCAPVRPVTGVEQRPQVVHEGEAIRQVQLDQGSSQIRGDARLREAQVVRD